MAEHLYCVLPAAKIRCLPSMLPIKAHTSCKIMLNNIILTIVCLALQRRSQPVPLSGRQSTRPLPILLTTTSSYKPLIQIIPIISGGWRPSRARSPLD